MIKQLIDSYPNITSNRCLKVENSNFFIEDRDKKITIFYKESEAKSQFFKITNKTQKKTRFLAVDNCIFLDKDGKRCDSIIFNNKEFLFIELKKINKSNANRSMKMAIKQLQSTIKDFTTRINFSNYNLEAYVCIGKRGIPRNNATSKAEKVNFMIDYNVKLFTSCNKEFN